MLAERARYAARKRIQSTKNMHANIALLLRFHARTTIDQRRGDRLICEQKITNLPIIVWRLNNGCLRQLQEATAATVTDHPEEKQAEFEVSASSNSDRSPGRKTSGIWSICIIFYTKDLEPFADCNIANHLASVPISDTYHPHFPNLLMVCHSIAPIRQYSEP